MESAIEIAENPALVIAVAGIVDVLADLPEPTRRHLAEGLAQDDSAIMRGLSLAARWWRPPGTMTRLQLASVLHAAGRDRPAVRRLLDELDESEPLWRALAAGLRVVVVGDG
ncbi:MAG: hypothetical protein ACYDD6_12525 [Acidimicrobiales bacterium]